MQAGVKIAVGFTPPLAVGEPRLVDRYHTLYMQHVYIFDITYPLCFIPAPIVVFVLYTIRSVFALYTVL